ncbi:KH domain-containing protein [Coleofasciculus chthonoplastes]|uniref:KH domain-containing protein n=1 Tax=Coleofasciculus TaxID=669368 RepID=UPI0005C5F14E|nr:KH domain-containing protein [Coleofasciculus chthonoplastes]
MSLNNKPVSEPGQKTSPDYGSLVRFLVEPFLESSTSLSLDCERAHANSRVWIRLAFDGEDKGRVFGRGGRNIQAIRTVIQGVAKIAGESVYLDIYDESGGTSRREAPSGSRSQGRKGSPRRLPLPKPNSKPRS